MGKVLVTGGSGCVVQLIEVGVGLGVHGGLAELVGCPGAGRRG